MNMRRVGEMNKDGNFRTRNGNSPISRRGPPIGRCLSRMPLLARRFFRPVNGRQDRAKKALAKRD